MASVAHGQTTPPTVSSTNPSLDLAFNIAAEVARSILGILSKELQPFPSLNRAETTLPSDSRADQQEPRAEHAEASRVECSEHVNSPLPSDECSMTSPPRSDKGLAMELALIQWSSPPMFLYWSKTLPMWEQAKSLGEMMNSLHNQWVLTQNAPFRPRPMRRLEDESMKPLLMSESLFDQQITNNIVDSYIPLGMMANARRCKSNVLIGLLK